GLLLAQGFDRPFLALAGAFPFNFYPMLAMGMVLFIVLSGRDFGPMKKAELRARNEGKLLRDGATPMISSDVASLKKKDKIPARALNMIVPLGVMAGLMPVMLAATGWSALENPETRSFFGNVFLAIGQGSGSASVLYSVLIAVVVAMILYKSQRLFTFSELMDLTFKGVGGLIPLAALMMLAFAIGAVCRDLGTGVYVAEVTKSWLSPNLAPLVVFVVSCFIAFSTGTSWGTFAIMIAIGVPMAETLGASMSMTIAAALGGGVFGDHCSPISDTTIISSMASASDLIDHVKTQLPYALVAGGVAALLYFVLGFVIH
ncbi:MAG: sodium:solute symporter, partial [Ignavibacteriales bacterium]|nr:sodium:solute symporter [Ignavibacteriales bacterium]